MSYLLEQLKTLIEGKVLLLLRENEFEELLQAAVPSLLMELDDTTDGRRANILRGLISKLERVQTKGEPVWELPRMLN